jgi:hypothetical protein
MPSPAMSDQNPHRAKEAHAKVCLLLDLDNLEKI